MNEGRAHRILEQKLEFVDHPSFADPAVAAVILAPMPASGAKSASRVKPPVGLPPYLASLYGDGTLLSREQEAHQFRKMNYLKFRAAQLRDRLVPEKARALVLDAIERFQEEGWPSKTRSSAPICDWSCRSPRSVSVPRTTSSSWSVTAT